MTKLLRFFRPSHQHTAFSATLLLISAVMLSRVIGYARDAYIAWAYGAAGATDAYVAAFTLPDFLNYIVAGGAASITFISIYTRFLAEKRDDDAEKTFSIIITVMTAVMIVGTIVTEIFAPQFVRWFVKGFTPDKVDLCVHLTRILLPAQIFFYVGGVVSAVLLSHRLFLFPAFGPLLYNVFIILGGVIGGRQFGIASLAYGALIGSFAGPFLASVIGAARIGTGYKPSFDVTNPAFREWVKLSIPLMLGVSLVTADDWILRHYAASHVGDITRLTFAKRLFAVPIAVLGQATGQASLPFFARLFNEKKLKEYAETVNDSVCRVSAAALLVTAWMMAAALPVIDLVYRRGRFSFEDSQTSAVYFFWFSLSLILWSAQGLYARAFYAAGDTLTPMAAVTAITALSMPVYSVLFHTFGAVGLAWASDIGIGANLLALALLLHHRKLVPLGGLLWGELGKALVTAIVAGAISFEVAKVVPLGRALHGSRATDVAQLALVSITWAAAVAAGLWLLRSDLPRALRNRKGTAYPAVAEGQSKEILGAGREA
ncbi:MAG TPA: murein biosynthesis integral membrane protein MurJ [Candidatus Solibacter sp.]|nr:murein biosynthesis integral membrane protein MurJ [Candidatus Solibacter sp.]